MTLEEALELKPSDIITPIDISYASTYATLMVLDQPERHDVITPAKRKIKLVSLNAIVIDIDWLEVKKDYIINPSLYKVLATA